MDTLLVESPPIGNIVPWVKIRRHTYIAMLCKMLLCQARVGNYVNVNNISTKVVDMEACMFRMFCYNKVVMTLVELSGCLLFYNERYYT